MSITRSAESSTAPAKSEVSREAKLSRTPVVLFFGTSLTAGYGLDPAQAFPSLIEKKARDEGLPIRAIRDPEARLRQLVIGEPAVTGNPHLALFRLARIRQDIVHVSVASIAVAEVALTVLDHPTGRHGFDTLDNDDRSREIIRLALDFFVRHLSR